MLHRHTQKIFFQKTLFQKTLSIACLFVVCCVPLRAQDTNETEANIPTEITDAFRAGNSRLLGSWLSARTLITLEKEPSLYGPKDAQEILRKFFKDNPPLGFDLIYQGTTEKEKSKTGNSLLYYIATYRSQKNYIMYLLVRRDAKGHRIEALSFNAE